MNFVKVSKMFSKMVPGTVNYLRYSVNVVIPDSYNRNFFDDNTIKSEILELFSNKEINSIQLENLINSIRYDVGRFSNKKTKRFNDLIWKKMISEDVSLNTNHFNLIYDSYVSSRIEFHPVTFVGALKQKNITFNNATLDHILRGFASLGDVESSLKVVEKMDSLNVPFNPAKYSWLIGCFIRANQPEKAEEYFKKVEEEKLYYSLQSVGFICCAYASKCDLDNCIRVLEEFNFKGEEYDKVVLQYEVLTELIQCGADEDCLIQYFNYLNKTENFKSLLFGISRLSRYGLFDGCMLLLKHTTLKLTAHDWSLIAQKFTAGKAPYKYLDVLMKNIDNNVHGIINVLRDFKPFDRALNIFRKTLKYSDIGLNKTLLLNMLINASTEPDHVRAAWQVMSILMATINFQTLSSILLSSPIRVLLRLSPEQTYESLLDTFGPNYAILEDHMAFACVINCLVLNGPTAAAELYEKYFRNQQRGFDVRLLDIAFFIYKNNADFESVCVTINEIESYLSPQAYVNCLRNVLNDGLRFLSAEDFEKLLQFLLSKSLFRKDRNWMKLIRNNKRYNDDIAKVVERNVLNLEPDEEAFS